MHPGRARDARHRAPRTRRPARTDPPRAGQAGQSFRMPERRVGHSTAAGPPGVAFRGSDRTRPSRHVVERVVRNGHRVRTATSARRRPVSAGARDEQLRGGLARTRCSRARPEPRRAPRAAKRRRTRGRTRRHAAGERPRLCATPRPPCHSAPEAPGPTRPASITAPGDRAASERVVRADSREAGANDREVHSARAARSGKGRRGAVVPTGRRCSSRGRCRDSAGRRGRRRTARCGRRTVLWSAPPSRAEQHDGRRRGRPRRKAPRASRTSRRRRDAGASTARVPPADASLAPRGARRCGVLQVCAM